MSFVFSGKCNIISLSLMRKIPIFTGNHSENEKNIRDNEKMFIFTGGHRSEECEKSLADN